MQARQTRRQGELERLINTVQHGGIQIPYAAERVRDAFSV